MSDINMSDVKSNDIHTVESCPPVKDADSNAPRTVKGVIPIGQIEMTEEERRLVSTLQAVHNGHRVTRRCI
jgi:hypothetical protein